MSSQPSLSAVPASVAVAAGTTAADALAAAGVPLTGPSAAVVVRDLDVHAWQRDVIERLSTRRIVVVELGWPSHEPPAAEAYIVTHGAALASTRAAAELLTNGKV